jgi:hypothetical protein
MKTDRHIPRALTGVVKLSHFVERLGGSHPRSRAAQALVCRLLACVIVAAIPLFADGRSLHAQQWSTPPTATPTAATPQAATPQRSTPQRSTPQRSTAGQPLTGGATRATSLNQLALQGQTGEVSRSRRSESALAAIAENGSAVANADAALQPETLEQSDPRAVGLLHKVLTMLVYGPAFHAKVRETVWTNGREVVGVGTYEQAGEGSGRFQLQLTMHDGDGKHRLQQISDGRLAWTRNEIAGKVTLRRVDVGRLDEWVGKSVGHLEIAPSLAVGAWAELLTTIGRDHVLKVVGARLEGEPVWVLTGRLKADRRAQVMTESGRDEWPMLYPTRVRIAVRSQPDPSTGFGELLPVRFEFWSDPVHAEASSDQEAIATNTAIDEGRLITLIELYSIQPINAPPAERFRFENQDAEVNFINETDRYIRSYGVQLTERELRTLRR